MKNKNTLKIVIGVAVVIVASLVGLLILKIKKIEEIKVGMTRNDVISILDKGKYEYTEQEDGHGLYIIEVKEAIIKKVKGSLEIKIDSVRDKVQYIKFYPDVDGYNDISEPVSIIYNYLMKRYGEPGANGFETQKSVSKLWSVNETNIVFTYPVEGDEEEIYILWILHENKEYELNFIMAWNLILILIKYKLPYKVH